MTTHCIVVKRTHMGIAMVITMVPMRFNIFSSTNYGIFVAIFIVVLSDAVFDKVKLFVEVTMLLLLLSAKVHLNNTFTFCYLNHTV